MSVSNASERNCPWDAKPRRKDALRQCSANTEPGMSSPAPTFEIIACCSAMAFARGENGSGLGETVQKSPRILAPSLLHYIQFLAPLETCDRTAT